MSQEEARTTMEQLNKQLISPPPNSSTKFLETYGDQITKTLIEYDRGLFNAMRIPSEIIPPETISFTQTAPEAPSAGDVYYDTYTAQYIFNGTTWMIMDEKDFKREEIEEETPEEAYDRAMKMLK